MTKMKICGMRHAADLDICRGADYLGFVVRSESPRNLEMGAARELMSSCGNRKVVVTTEMDRKELERIVGLLEPDVLQMHVPLDEGLLKFVAGLGAEVWGMVPMSPGTRVMKERLNDCHALVLDTPGDRSGGNGRTHDWNTSREVRDALHPFPVVLAGGLRPNNAALAVRNVAPFAVDVSSGVESGDGKDHSLVNAFMEAIRTVDML